MDLKSGSTKAARPLQRAQLKILVGLLSVILGVVCCMNLYKYQVFPFDGPNQAELPAVSPTREQPIGQSTIEAAGEKSARPEPVDWSSEPATIDPAGVTVTFRDDFVVEISGSSPSWDDALKQESTVQGLLSGKYIVENNLTWHPAAQPQVEFNFRSIEVETETLFASGDADLAEESEALAISAQIVRDEPDLIVEVIGHTDDDGDARSNRRLGIDRAEAVALYLITEGVEPEQIVEWSAGEARPKYSNDSDQKRRNRRIELNFIPRPNSDLDNRSAN